MTRQVYLYVGRTCQNPRTPYATVRDAVAGARYRQAQSRSVGQTAQPYIVVVDNRAVTTVYPTEG